MQCQQQATVELISASEHIGINRRPAWLIVRSNLGNTIPDTVHRQRLYECVFGAVVVFFSRPGPRIVCMQDLMATNQTPWGTWLKTRECERLHR